MLMVVCLFACLGGCCNSFLLLGVDDMAEGAWLQPVLFRSLDRLAFIWYFLSPWLSLCMLSDWVDYIYFFACF